MIDPNVDEARRYLIEDPAYSQALARIALVKGVGAASEDAPRVNLVGDPYYTDGLRAVMFFEPRPRTLAKLDFVKGVGRVMASEPRITPGGATYHTDGLRAVLLFEKGNVSLSDIGFFEWERLLDHDRKQRGTASAQ